MDYKSDLVQKLHRHRGIYGGMPYQVAGRIFIPNGTVLATTDNLLFIPVGENQAVKRVTLMVKGGLGAAQGSIGYFQMLDANGDPVVVTRQGPNGDAASKFTSPATNATAYKSAAVLGASNAYVEQIVAAPHVLEGPVWVGIDITTGGTATADTVIELGVEFDGEKLPQDSGFSYGDNASYLLD